MSVTASPATLPLSSASTSASTSASNSPLLLSSSSLSTTPALLSLSSSPSFLPLPSTSSVLKNVDKMKPLHTLASLFPSNDKRKDYANRTELRSRLIAMMKNIRQGVIISEQLEEENRKNIESWQQNIQSLQEEVNSAQLQSVELDISLKDLQHAFKDEQAQAQEIVFAKIDCINTSIHDYKTRMEKDIQSEELEVLKLHEWKVQEPILRKEIDRIQKDQLIREAKQTEILKNLIVKWKIEKAKVKKAEAAQAFKRRQAYKVEIASELGLKPKLPNIAMQNEIKMLRQLIENITLENTTLAKELDSEKQLQQTNRTLRIQNTHAAVAASHRIEGLKTQHTMLMKMKESDNRHHEYLEDQQQQKEIAQLKIQERDRKIREIRTPMIQKEMARKAKSNSKPSTCPITSTVAISRTFITE